jgi:hypothetical protein
VNERRSSALERPAVKLAAFTCALGVMLGGGALLGAAIGPEPSESDSTAHGVDADGPEGLTASRDGYTLALATDTFAAGDEIALAFQIIGPDGEPVTEFDVDHDKELHLIVVGRDLVDYVHVHPERDDDGTWRITLPPRAAGPYRVFADFTPSGASSLTLGTDLAVAGDFSPSAPPEASESVDVDGYTVSLDGRLVAGAASTVTFSVSDGDGPVDDLEPYLGALGHLVAIRTGDLAYLHVHPAEESTEPGGPDVEFTVEVPAPGTYRLFLDFSHGGEVHTAAFTAEARHDEHTAGVPATESTEGGHGSH